VSEEIIGNWLNGRNDRDKLIIASKVTGPASRYTHIHEEPTRLDKNNIEKAVNASLKRLQTDYIDLYQIHWPDRETNRFGQWNYYHAPEKDGASIEETLESLDQLVKSGKIRFPGVSNETPWGLSEYLKQSERKKLARIVSLQNPYNLLNRTFETGLSEFTQREQISLLAYSPTAAASLSGKYLNNDRPEGARMTLFPHYKSYKNRQADNAIEKYVTLAKLNNLDPVQMALAFVNSRPFLTSTIIGATNMTQLKSNIASVEIELSKRIVKEIDKIHIAQPNPCP